MRSTVSYMLSHGSDETLMSHPDYEQHAHHHRCLLVLLRGIGLSKPRSLQKIFERIQKINNVKITDSSGQIRDIWIRYIHDYPIENNDWGDFQTHRRLLGLITVGKFDNQIELNELCRLHESLKVKYSSTLYDSRSILCGPQIQSDENNEINDSLNGKIKTNGGFIPPSNFKTHAFFYPENDICSDLENNITDFISSLFWILESKRLERSREKVDKVTLLFAPFEKKEIIGLDLDSRTNKKKCIGRLTKNLGDLTLQCGLIGESLNLFQTASEILSAINDSLWLGAAEEGLCTASSILLYPDIRQIEYFYRNGSLQDGLSTKLLDKNKINEKKTNYIIHGGGDCTITSKSSSSSSVSSITTSSSTSSGLSLNFKNYKTDNLPINILKPDDITQHYRKAIINYSQYRHANIIEIEATFKAARICIQQNKNLDVTMFLQNILFMDLNETGRVKRFEKLIELYQCIGYRRKAAFCQRLAAWRYVGQGNPNPDWSQSYKLMLDSFPGYMLSLDSLDVLNSPSGWPALQIDLLQYLITAAKRLGHSALATRHMTYLLQTQWNNMTLNEQKEMAIQLRSLSAQCEGSPVPLVLENGIVIPPANLTDLPFCLQMQIRDLQSHLKPIKKNIEKIDNGPFLFTPIHFNSIDRRDNKINDNKIVFKWIQHDPCEVILKLKNILPFELIVNDIRLLTNGIVFESLPQTILLQPLQTTTISLHGTPIESGQLEILGYSTHTLGVKSNCRLKHMKNRKMPSNYLVDVIPALPKISIKTSLPQTATFSNFSNSDSVITSVNLILYNGETTECIITIKNETNIPIEYLDFMFKSNFDIDLQKKIFHINDKDIEKNLPIPPYESIDFRIEIYGEADFLLTSNQQLINSLCNSDVIGTSCNLFNNGINNNEINSLNHSIISSGHASLPSQISSPTHLNILKRNELTSSFRSSNSAGQSSLATLSLIQPSTGISNHNYETQLKFKYSGGEALKEGYCRQCAILFSIEMLPSAQITNWDVLPAEISSQFYLVLDVANLTTQEMSLHYTSNKNILIEAKESCRLPIPVDRCSLQNSKNKDIKCDGEKFSNDIGQDVQVESGILPSYTQVSLQACSEHIAQRVKLKWTLTGTETSGIASLQGISFSPALIDLIIVSPLQWNISFNNTPVHPQSEVVCTAGQSVSLDISICNLSKSPLHNLALTVQFYQDYQNGIHHYHLETRVTMSGPNQIHIPFLQNGEDVRHECNIIFFTAGRFKANIQCRSLQNIPFGNSSESNYSSNLSSDVCRMANYDVQHHQNNGINSGYTSYNEPQHIWKFIPPIEITVVNE